MKSLSTIATASHPTGLLATKGIELLTFNTSNGFKSSIILEELKETYGVQYSVQAIDIFQNVNKEPWYNALAPAEKMPIIVDHDNDGLVAFDGLAILNYLPRVYDKERRFSFEDLLEASEAEQSLTWQHSAIGPMQAQANFFYRFSPERYAFPTQKFVGEVKRFFGVLDKRSQERSYVAGQGIGTRLWILRSFRSLALLLSLGLSLNAERRSNLYSWWQRIGERPAVQKGMSVPGGLYFLHGYKNLKKMWEEDLEGMGEREQPLIEALQKARKEFGTV